VLEFHKKMEYRDSLVTIIQVDRKTGVVVGKRPRCPRSQLSKGDEHAQLTHGALKKLSLDFATGRRSSFEHAPPYFVENDANYSLAKAYKILRKDVQERQS
jgi:hypothetical protein